MRHKLCLICSLALLAAALTGCALLPTATQPTLPPLEAEPTVAVPVEETLVPGAQAVILWEPFALDRPQGILLSEMILGFEAANPDLQVEVVAKSGYAALHEALLAELPVGELPDLALAFPTMIAEYAQAGIVAPLDDFLADPETGLTAEDLVDLYPGLLSAGRLYGSDGPLMAFPFAPTAVGLWVNRTLLSQAGWPQPPLTWAEFEQACFDVWGQTGVRCYAFTESVTTFNAWLYSRGGQQLDESGRLAAFNSPAGVDSLALLRRLIDAGLAWRPEGPYGDYVAFANGQAAFAFSSTGNSPLYLDAYAGALQNGVPPFEWAQTLIPQADLAQPGTVLSGAGLFIVRSSPERELAAWRLVRWLTATEQTARWAGQLEALPVRASALSVMTDTLEAHPFVRAQVEQVLPYARPEPAVPGELEVRDILYTAILSVTQGFADPQTALDQAVVKANAVLAAQP